MVEFLTRARLRPAGGCAEAIPEDADEEVVRAELRIDDGLGVFCNPGAHVCFPAYQFEVKSVRRGDVGAKVRNDCIEPLALVRHVTRRGDEDSDSLDGCGHGYLQSAVADWET